jgi:c-di-GMP-binding flagellar brake protein YcgR
VQILIRRFQQSSRFSSSVIGYAADEYVIVKTPTESGFSVPLQNGEPMQVRMFTGTHVAEFETTLLRQFRAPVFYWHLEYPAAINLIGLRTAPRVRMDVTGRAQLSSPQESCDVRVLDVSADGGQIVGPDNLGKKEMVLALTVPLGQDADGKPNEVSMNATIKTLKPLGAEGNAPARCSYGLKFEFSTEVDQLRVQNFVLQRLHDEPGELI